MSSNYRLLSKEFLTKKDGSSEAIKAVVRKNKSYLSANLSFFGISGNETLLYFDAYSEKELKYVIDKLTTLEKEVGKFIEAVKKEAVEVQKEIDKQKKEE